jgi:nitroreductase
MALEKPFQEKLAFILGRRSIRVYRPGPVSEDYVQLLLEAAMSAPSAVGKDPWRFILLRERTSLAQVADLLPHGKMLADAALGIIVCGDLDEAHDRQLSYLLQDCSAAIENLLLAAHTLGLGTCWLGIHPREDRIRSVSRLLGLPANVIPVSGIAIGWPGEVKEPRTRYRPASVHRERWQA